MDPAGRAQRQATAGPAPDAPVTVVVVSWNTRELLIRCLDSLEAEARAGRANVYVVDNASDDGSAEAARRHARWAATIEPNANLGFGRAVNLVAKQTRSDWIACANADVALAPGALLELLAAARDPGVGCVAPRLVLPSGETQASVQGFPTLPYTLAFNLGLHRLGPVAHRLRMPGFQDRAGSGDVPWAIGALLLLRRSAFDDVGGFDETEWMYAEDLDLCWRLTESGWRIRYAAEARVNHQSRAATKQGFGDREVSRFMQSTYDVLVRRRGLVRAWMTAAINLFGTYIRLAWMLPLARVSPGREDALNALWGWRMVHGDGLRQLTATARERYGRAARTQDDDGPRGRTTDQ